MRFPFKPLTTDFMTKYICKRSALYKFMFVITYLMRVNNFIFYLNTFLRWFSYFVYIFGVHIYYFLNIKVIMSEYSFYESIIRV